MNCQAIFNFFIKVLAVVGNANLDIWTFCKKFYVVPKTTFKSAWCVFGWSGYGSKVEDCRQLHSQYLPSFSNRWRMPRKQCASTAGRNYRNLLWFQLCFLEVILFFIIHFEKFASVVRFFDKQHSIVNSLKRCFRASLFWKISAQ